jgi:UDP-2-acetamido-3-amino-2,3-dideoxy-glucuronate N-acetyltransferase
MIHPKSEVATKKIGKGTTIWQFSVILEGAQIGSDCNVNCHTFIENDVVIGDNVTVKAGVYLWDGITVEDRVFIGPNVTFTNNKNPRAGAHKKKLDRIILRKNCSIGANATIVGPCEIGEYALIGAGSVVTRSIPPYALALGSPAKVVGFVNSDGQKMKETSEGFLSSDGKIFKLP